MTTIKHFRISDDNIPGVLYYESNRGRTVAICAASMLRAKGYRCTAEENVGGTWVEINQ